MIPGIFLFISICTFSQQKFSKEFSFVNDNDLYISVKKDQYYTNGMFFSFRTLADHSEKLHKKIYEMQLGHEIYTPYRANVTNIARHDRPFAGYFYGNFGVIRAYKTNTIVKTNIQLGVLGEDAFGEELQDFIHRIYNFRSSNGWDYQIRNTLALNFDFEYIKVLGKNNSNHSDINFVGKLRLGTIFNELALGFTGRISFNQIQSISNSIAFNTHLNNNKTSFNREIESFFYYNPSLALIAYDATIQGSLFNNNSPITYIPRAIRFDIEVGYRFTSNRWNFGYAFHFHSNKLQNLRNDKGNYYGRLFFSYLFN